MLDKQRERTAKTRHKVYHVHFAFVVGLVGLLFIAALLVLQLSSPPKASHAEPAGELVAFPGTIAPLIAHSRLIGPAHPRQHISLSLGLRLRNAANLAGYVQTLSHMQATYRHFLSSAQFASAFGPNKVSYDMLSQFLQNNGFIITPTDNHHLLIAFSGTIGQAEQTFHVAINTYSAPTGYTFYANASNPLLPSSLISMVQSIGGLNNATQWHRPTPTMNETPRLRPLASPALSSRNTFCPGAQTGYLTPSQTAAAYNLNGLYSAHYAGGGQSIALFELDTFPMHDLLTYAACYGHSRTPVRTIVSGSGQVPTDGGVQEVELDAELILSAVPRLGTLDIYEAANDTADYNAEWAQIIADAVPVVSTSWGDCERNIDPQEIQQENVYFMAAAAQGQSIFAASGDSGSAGCEFDNPNNPDTRLNAGDPGTQPFVISVGGTSLTMHNGTGYGSETTWNDQYGASGGGISQYWQAPAWQNTQGVQNSYSNNTVCGAPSGTICRETPDVSLQADPNNGYLFYCSSVAAGCSSNGGWYIIGGTSAAAPMWAALAAMANEMSLRQGGLNLGFLNPLLYQIANNPRLYASSFHDITRGTDDYNGQNNGAYPATPHYDMATGLGSYNAYNLATALVALAQNAGGQRASPTSKTWYFAEGSVGGGFQEYLTLQNPDVTQTAHVAVTYLFESQPPVVVSHIVPPSSRTTINVNADLHMKPSASHTSIAAIVQVTGGPGIVAERPMYFNFNGIQSGTDVVGTTTPNTNYYFPEADTRQSGRNYYTFITILNPSSTQTATTVLTFYTGSCGQSGQSACPTQTVITPPLHRGTGTPLALGLDQQMAIGTTSNLPVVVERPMYFRDTIPSVGGTITGAADEVGVPTPGNNWLFAEGYTGNHFQQYYVLANFSTTATTAHIRLEYVNGHSQMIDVTVPALGQAYVDINQANAQPYGTCDVSPCMTTTSNSAEITSDAPIVAERLMYFHLPGSHGGSTETIGETGSAPQSVYTFAEGYTANSFQEFLTLLNPTNSDETVAITFFVDTYVIQQQIIVKAHSRQTLNINALVSPITNTYVNGSGAPAVSLIVRALGTNATLVAERPLYFNFNGISGGTDVVGYTGG
ncbi:MAG TPA: S53 family serine peptidase [Ktedonobacteraceae bacterium]|nr:S53 family serine peptidase [Ktedonobacteraceae bacterium]